MRRSAGTVTTQGRIRPHVRSKSRLCLFVLLAVLANPAAHAACEGNIAIPAGAGAVPLRAYDGFFRSPARLALDRTTGTVYITDPANGRVVGRGFDGRLVHELDGIGHPVSLAVSLGGRLLVGDGKDGQVTAYDPAGVALFRLGIGAGEFGFPNDIDVHPVSGDIYVTDSEAHEVRRYAAQDGALLGSFGGFGTAGAQFDVPTGIHVDLAGVHVVDQRNSAIKTFSPEGTLQSAFPTFNVARGFFCGGFSCGRSRVFDQGLWIDQGGRVFVADSFGSQVVTGPANGLVDAVIGAMGDGPGELRTPTDVVVDGCGRLCGLMKCSSAWSKRETCMPRWSSSRRRVGHFPISLLT